MPAAAPAARMGSASALVMSSTASETTRMATEAGWTNSGVVNE
jgi:hypothetical protein